MLKQFTSVAVDQLERCDLPSSKLTAEFIPSSVADPNNVILFNLF
jgi:hypothetical protein